MIPEIPGIKVSEPRILSSLRSNVTDLLELKHSRFPGAQPVSFAKRHLDSLKTSNYFVSEKADGVRCLFYTRQTTVGAETFLIDRKNDYYGMGVGLPLPSNGTNGWYNDTLLDGELVFEKDRLLFLFFDALVVGGKNITSRPYTKRLGYLRELILKPLMKFIAENPKFEGAWPFKMIQKRLELSYNVGIVFDHMKTYNHQTDGVLFTSVEDPYIAGTCQTMLKWKPAHENTVDFRVNVVQTSDGVQYDLQCADHGFVTLGQLELDNDLEKEWASSPPHHRVIECRYNAASSHWNFSRFRDDKDGPNHISVYEKILDSIKDNVTQEEIEAAVSDIYAGWKGRDPKTPRPTPRHH